MFGLAKKKGFRVVLTGKLCSLHMPKYSDLDISDC